MAKKKSVKSKVKAKPLSKVKVLKQKLEFDKKQLFIAIICSFIAGIILTLLVLNSSLLTSTGWAGSSSNIDLLQIGDESPLSESQNSMQTQLTGNIDSNIGADCSLITSYDRGTYLSQTTEYGESMIKTALSLNLHQNWVSMDENEIPDTLETNGWSLVGDVIDFSSDNSYYPSGGQAYVVVDDCNQNLVVAFRGSLGDNWRETFSNILTDAFAVKSNMRWIGGSLKNTKIHTGFNSEYMKVSNNIIEKVNQYPDYDVYVTGFSLGAAMATISAADIETNTVSSPILYTGGSPRIGGDDFISDFPQVVETHFRIVYDQDPVVMIPSYQDFPDDSLIDGYASEYNHFIGELFDEYLVEQLSSNPFLEKILDKLEELFTEPFQDLLRAKFGDYHHTGLLLQLDSDGQIEYAPTVELEEADKSHHTYEDYRDVLLKHLLICQNSDCTAELETAADEEREKNEALSS